MDQTPPEVLHQIFDLLGFSDVCALRCVAKKYASIGIEYLTDQIRFHCTAESIARAKELANHATLKNQVKVLVMEGNLLADIGCEHSYASHYDSAHHADEKPQHPEMPCTSRERRLYERNLAKFNQEVLHKYETYRIAWKKQQTLIQTPAYSQIGRAITLALPRLEMIRLSTVGRCHHTLSERFIKDFAVDCAMPMDQDSEHSAVQLKHLLVPTGTPLRSLQFLEVHVLSPAFFSSTPQAVLTEAFRDLRTVSLTFRLSTTERAGIDLGGTDRCYSKLLKNHLSDALAAATELKNLTINFDDFGLYVPAINVKSIMGDSTWSQLRQLDLDNISADEEYLAKALHRQPLLDSFFLTFALLESGTWRTLIESLSKMHLKIFMPQGVFEEKNGEHFLMDFVDAEAWMEDQIEITMAEHISNYVTTSHKDYPDVSPLDLEYDDLDNLKENYFSMLSDPESGMDSELLDSDMDESDSDIPDLEEITDAGNAPSPDMVESDSDVPELEPMDCTID